MNSIIGKLQQGRFFGMTSANHVVTGGVTAQGNISLQNQGNGGHLTLDRADFGWEEKEFGAEGMLMRTQLMQLSKMANNMQFSNAASYKSPQINKI
jgi:hypothetical protein